VGTLIVATGLCSPGADPCRLGSAGVAQRLWSVRFAV